MATGSRPFIKQPAKSSESGYILITAVWLLLLGASIVAVIMLHNLRTAKEYSFEREMLQLRFAKESAIETVVADIVFNGPRSEFARLPAEVTYTIGGTQMNVRVSSENGKIDINQADPALIERALRGLGISALPRQVFLNSIAGERSAGRLYQSITDVERAMEQAGIDGGNGFCPEQFFTVYSGLSQPQPNQMDAALARALGGASLAAQVRTKLGSAMRVEVSAIEGLPLVAIIRTSGLIEQSYSVLDWSNMRGCYEAIN